MIPKLSEWTTLNGRVKHLAEKYSLLHHGLCGVGWNGYTNEVKRLYPADGKDLPMCLKCKRELERIKK